MTEDNGILHNWLYSFLPVGERNYPTLVGFCKQCRHTFSYVMKIKDPKYAASPAYEEFDARIPKTGCFPIDDLPKL